MSNALVEGKYFRVCQISKVTSIDNGIITIITCGIKDGLAIEKRCKDKEHYYVVAFVRKDDAQNDAQNDAQIVLEDVAFRTIDIIDDSMSIEDSWEMMHEYRNCVEFAKHTLEDILNENRVF